MKVQLAYILIATLVLCSCEGNKKCNDASCKKPLACKLTSAEFRERKATVLASLKKQVMARQELEDGYVFTFHMGDSISIHHELAEFVKTEKQCCDFFEFKVGNVSDNSGVWLKITGPEGTKEFIEKELGLLY